MQRAIVTGGTSGIGEAITKALRNKGMRVIVGAKYGFGHDDSLALDVADEKSIQKFVMQATAKLNAPVDLLVNCAGVNAICPLGSITLKFMADIMNVNAFGTVLMTKYLAPQLAESMGSVCNIVSNAAHLPMSNSVAYNMSKAAQRIATQQMGRELGALGITVFGVAPNKCKGTAMSRYIDRQVCETQRISQDEMARKQLAQLPAGEETDVETLAEFVAFLCDRKDNHKYLQGCVIPYGGPSL